MFTTEKHRILPVLVVAMCLALGSSFGLASGALAADDVAERLEQARAALNDARYERAARLYNEVFEASGDDAAAAGDALYWEAFARYRLDRTSELKAAARLLQLQQERFAVAKMAAEGQALAARIAGELAERGEAAAVREITEMASEEDLRRDTRLAALQSLMHMDSERALPVLKKIVQDPSPENRELRRDAVFILCQKSGSEAEDLIIDMLKNETDPEFQGDLVMCLAQTGSDRALQVMMELFRETKDEEVAEMTLHAIGRFGGSRVFDFLVEVAGDSGRDAEVRGQALLSLSMTDDDERVTDVLIKILHDEEDPEILEMALVSLSRLDDPRAASAILDIVVDKDVDEDFKAVALHFAAQNDQIDLQTLKKLYDQADSRDLKQQICHVLTRMEDEDAALDLLIAITRDEKDPEIRRDAVFWIGQFDNDRAAEYLLQVINDE